MTRSLNEIRRYRIVATDGEIGTVRDFLFTDDTWRIGYVVVDTGTWLPGRRVIISPSAMDKTDWHAQRLHMAMTKEQIKASPSIDSDKPVSLQRKFQYGVVDGWPMFGAKPVIAGSPEMAEIIESTVKQESDPRLRSVKEITGYHIQAIDGSIGHVEDFIADETDWTIRYIVVDTRNWMPGRKVLVAPWMISDVTWAGQNVHVQLSCQQVENSPEYDPEAPVNREYEEVFYDYYGRPVYW